RLLSELHALSLHDALPIFPSGASTYTYSGSSNIVSPATNTTYLVSGTSPAGCASTLSAVSNVTVVARPVVAVNSGSICNGQSFVDRKSTRLNSSHVKISYA